MPHNFAERSGVAALGLCNPASFQDDSPCCPTMELARTECRGPCRVKSPRGEILPEGIVANFLSWWRENVRQDRGVTNSPLSHKAHPVALHSARRTSVVPSCRNTSRWRNRVAAVGMWMCITLIVLTTFVQEEHWVSLAVRQWTAPPARTDQAEPPFSYYVFVNEVTLFQPYGSNRTRSYHVLETGKQTSIVFSFIAHPDTWEGSQVTLYLNSTQGGPNPWTVFRRIVHISYGDSWVCTADFSSQPTPSPPINCDGRLSVSIDVDRIVVDIGLPRPFYGFHASEQLQIKLRVNGNFNNAFILTPLVQVQSEAAGFNGLIMPLNAGVFFFDISKPNSMQALDTTFKTQPNGNALLITFQKPIYSDSGWTIVYPRSFAPVSVPEDCEHNQELNHRITRVSCPSTIATDYVAFQRVDYSLVTEFFELLVHESTEAELPLPTDAALATGISFSKARWVYPPASIGTIRWSPNIAFAEPNWSTFVSEGLKKTLYATVSLSATGFTASLPCYFVIELRNAHHVTGLKRVTTVILGNDLQSELQALPQRSGGYLNTMAHLVPAEHAQATFVFEIELMPFVPGAVTEAHIYATTRVGEIITSRLLWEDYRMGQTQSQAVLHGARIIGMAFRPVLEIQLSDLEPTVISFADCTRLAIGFMRRADAAVEARFNSELTPPESSVLLVNNIFVPQQVTSLEQTTLAITLYYQHYPSAELASAQLSCHFDSQQEAHMHGLNMTEGEELSGHILICEGTENQPPLLIMSKAWITLPYTTVSRVVDSAEPTTVAALSLDSFFNAIITTYPLETAHYPCRVDSNSVYSLIHIRTNRGSHPVQHRPSRNVPFLGSLTPPQAQNLVFRVPGDGPAVQHVYIDSNYQRIAASVHRSGLVQHGRGNVVRIDRFDVPDSSETYPPIDSSEVVAEDMEAFRELMRVKMLHSLDVINQTSLSIGTRIRFTYPRYAWRITCGAQVVIPQELPRLANDSDVNFAVQTYFNFVDLADGCRAITSATVEITGIRPEDTDMIDISPNDNNVVKFTWPIRYIPQSERSSLGEHFDPQLWQQMYIAPIGSVDLLDGMNQVISVAQVRLPAVFGPRVDHHALLVSWGTHRQFSIRMRYSRSFFARYLWAGNSTIADELVYGSYPAQSIGFGEGESARFVDDDNLYLRGTKSVCQDAAWSRKPSNFADAYPLLSDSLSCRIFPDAPTVEQDYGHSTSEPLDGTPVLTGYEAKDAITFQPLLKVQPDIYDKLRQGELISNFATFGTRLFVTIGDTCWPNPSEEAAWIRKSSYAPMYPVGDSPAITRAENDSADVCDAENTPHYEYFVGFKVPHQIRQLIPRDSDWNRPQVEGPTAVDEGSIASSFDHKHIILPTDPGRKHVKNSTDQCRIGILTPDLGASPDAKPLPFVYYTTAGPSRVLAVAGRSAHPNATASPVSFSQGFGLRLSSLVANPAWQQWGDYSQSQYVGDQALTISFSGLKHFTNQNTDGATSSMPERLARVNKLRLLSVGDEAHGSLTYDQVEDYEPPLPPHIDRLELKEEIPLSQLAGSARSVDIWTGSALADFCAGFTTCETCMNHPHTCHWAAVEDVVGCFWRFAELPVRTPVESCNGLGTCRSLTTVASCLRLDSDLDVALPRPAVPISSVSISTGLAWNPSPAMAEKAELVEAITSTADIEYQLARRAYIRQLGSECLVCAALLTQKDENDMESRELRFSLPLRQRSAFHISDDVNEATEGPNTHNPFTKQAISCFAAGSDPSYGRLAFPSKTPAALTDSRVPLVANASATSAPSISLNSTAGYPEVKDRPSKCLLAYDSIGYPSDAMIPYLAKIIERHAFPQRKWTKRSILAATRTIRVRATVGNETREHYQTLRYYLYSTSSPIGLSTELGPKQTDNSWIRFVVQPSNVFGRLYPFDTAAESTHGWEIVDDNQVRYRYKLAQNMNQLHDMEIYDQLQSINRTVLLHTPANYGSASSNYVFSVTIDPRGNAGVVGIVFRVSIPEMTYTGTPNYRGKPGKGVRTVGRGFYTVEWGSLRMSSCHPFDSDPALSRGYGRYDTLRLIYHSGLYDQPYETILAELPIHSEWALGQANVDGGHGYDPDSILLVTVAVREAVRYRVDLGRLATGTDIQVFASMYPRRGSGIDFETLRSLKHFPLPLALSYFHTLRVRPRIGSIGLLARGVQEVYFSAIEWYQMIDPIGPLKYPHEEAERASTPSAEAVVKTVFNALSMRHDRTQGLYSIPYSGHRAISVFASASPSKLLTSVNIGINIAQRSCDPDVPIGGSPSQNLVSLVSPSGLMEAMQPENSGGDPGSLIWLLFPSHAVYPTSSILLGAVRCSPTSGQHRLLAAMTHPSQSVLNALATTFYLPVFCSAYEPFSDLFPPTTAETIMNFNEGLELQQECIDEQCSSLWPAVSASSFIFGSSSANITCSLQIPETSELVLLHIVGDWRKLASTKALPGFAADSCQTGLLQASASQGPQGRGYGLTNDWFARDQESPSQPRVRMKGLYMHPAMRPAPLSWSPTVDVGSVSEEAISHSESIVVDGMPSPTAFPNEELRDLIYAPNATTIDPGIDPNAMYYTLAVRNPFVVDDAFKLSAQSVGLSSWCGFPQNPENAILSDNCAAASDGLPTPYMMGNLPNWAWSPYFSLNDTTDLAVSVAPDAPVQFELNLQYESSIWMEQGWKIIIYRDEYSAPEEGVGFRPVINAVLTPSPLQLGWFNDQSMTLSGLVDTSLSSGGPKRPSNYAVGSSNPSAAIEIDPLNIVSPVQNGFALVAQRGLWDAAAVVMHGNEPYHRVYLTLWVEFRRSNTSRDYDDELAVLDSTPLALRLHLPKGEPKIQSVRFAGYGAASEFMYEIVVATSHMISGITLTPTACLGNSSGVLVPRSYGACSTAHSVVYEDGRHLLTSSSLLLGPLVSFSILTNGVEFEPVLPPLDLPFLSIAPVELPDPEMPENECIQVVGPFAGSVQSGTEGDVGVPDSVLDLYQFIAFPLNSDGEELPAIPIHLEPHYWKAFGEAVFSQAKVCLTPPNFHPSIKQFRLAMRFVVWAPDVQEPRVAEVSTILQHRTQLPVLAHAVYFKENGDEVPLQVSDGNLVEVPADYHAEKSNLTVHLEFADNGAVLGWKGNFVWQSSVGNIWDFERMLEPGPAQYEGSHHIPGRCMLDGSCHGTPFRHLLGRFTIGATVNPETLPLVAFFSECKEAMKIYAYDRLVFWHANPYLFCYGASTSDGWRIDNNGALTVHSYRFKVAAIPPSSDLYELERFRRAIVIPSRFELTYFNESMCAVTSFNMTFLDRPDLRTLTIRYAPIAPDFSISPNQGLSFQTELASLQVQSNDDIRFGRLYIPLPHSVIPNDWSNKRHSAKCRVAGSDPVPFLLTNMQITLSAMGNNILNETDTTEIQSLQCKSPQIVSPSDTRALSTLSTSLGETGLNSIKSFLSCFPRANEEMIVPPAFTVLRLTWDQFEGTTKIGTSLTVVFPPNLAFPVPHPRPRYTSAPAPFDIPVISQYQWVRIPRMHIVYLGAQDFRTNGGESTNTTVLLGTEDVELSYQSVSAGWALVGALTGINPENQRLGYVVTLEFRKVVEDEIYYTNLTLYDGQIQKWKHATISSVGTTAFPYWSTWTSNQGEAVTANIVRDYYRHAKVIFDVESLGYTMGVNATSELPVELPTTGYIEWSESTWIFMEVGCVVDPVAGPFSDTKKPRIPCYVDEGGSKLYCAWLPIIWCAQGLLLTPILEGVSLYESPASEIVHVQGPNTLQGSFYFPFSHSEVPIALSTPQILQRNDGFDFLFTMGYIPALDELLPSEHFSITMYHGQVQTWFGDAEPEHAEVYSVSRNITVTRGGPARSLYPIGAHRFTFQIGSVVLTRTFVLHELAVEGILGAHGSSFAVITSSLGQNNLAYPMMTEVRFQLMPYVEETADVLTTELCREYAIPADNTETLPKGSCASNPTFAASSVMELERSKVLGFPDGSRLAWIVNGFNSPALGKFLVRAEIKNFVDRLVDTVWYSAPSSLSFNETTAAWNEWVSVMQPDVLISIFQENDPESIASGELTIPSGVSFSELASSRCSQYFDIDNVVRLRNCTYAPELEITISGSNLISTRVLEVLGNWNGTEPSPADLIRPYHLNDEMNYPAYFILLFPRDPETLSRIPALRTNPSQAQLDPAAIKCNLVRATSRNNVTCMVRPALVGEYDMIMYRPGLTAIHLESAVHAVANSLRPEGSLALCDGYSSPSLATAVTATTETYLCIHGVFPSCDPNQSRATVRLGYGLNMNTRYVESPTPSDLLGGGGALGFGSGELRTEPSLGAHTDDDDDELVRGRIRYVRLLGQPFSTLAELSYNCLVEYFDCELIRCRLPDAHNHQLSILVQIDGETILPHNQTISILRPIQFAPNTIRASFDPEYDTSVTGISHAVVSSTVLPTVAVNSLEMPALHLTRAAAESILGTSLPQHNMSAEASSPGYVGYIVKDILTAKVNEQGQYVATGLESRTHLGPQEAFGELFSLMYDETPREAGQGPSTSLDGLRMCTRALAREVPDTSAYALICRVSLDAAQLDSVARVSGIITPVRSLYLVPRHAYGLSQNALFSPIGTEDTWAFAFPGNVLLNVTGCSEQIEDADLSDMAITKSTGGCPPVGGQAIRIALQLQPPELLQSDPELVILVDGVPCSEVAVVVTEENLAANLVIVLYECKLPPGLGRVPLTVVVGEKILIHSHPIEGPFIEYSSPNVLAVGGCAPTPDGFSTLDCEWREVEGDLQATSESNGYSTMSTGSYKNSYTIQRISDLRQVYTLWSAAFRELSASPTTTAGRLARRFAMTNLARERGWYDGDATLIDNDFSAISASLEWMQVGASYAVITIIGTGFGPERSPIAVFVGSRPCVNVQRDVASPQTRLTCTIQPGLVRHAPVAIVPLNWRTIPRSSALEGPARVSYIDCPSGHYAKIRTAADAGPDTPAPEVKVESSQVCLPCPVGRYAHAVSGADKLASSIFKRECYPCPAGKYSAKLQASDSCLNCPAGRFRASSTSEPSALGFSTSDESLAQLYLQWLEDGIPQPAAGQSMIDLVIDTQCTPCPTNTVSEAEGSAGCSPCPAGRVATPGSASCHPCPGGYKQVRVTSLAMNSAESLCELCPIGKFRKSVSDLGGCEMCQPGSVTLGKRGSLNCTVCTPGKFANPETSTCDDCPVGRFSSDFGSVACHACPAGRFHAGTQGATRCDSCPIGRYRERDPQNDVSFSTLPNPSAASCLPCPTGKFSATPGSERCMDCELGWISDEASAILDGHNGPGTRSGATQCRSCPQGATTFNAGATECSPCELGSSTPISGSSKCQMCPAGTRSTSLEEIGFEEFRICRACAPGYFAPRGNSTMCRACPNGRYNLQFGATSCSHCPHGSTRTGDALECEPCPPGRHYKQVPDDTGLDFTGQCIDAPLGMFTPQAGMVHAIPCPAGRYANVPGQSSCAICAAGKTTGPNDPTTCKPCDAGYFASQPGLPVCYPCPAGRFSAVAGATGCGGCSVGKYTSDIGATVCSECPPGYYAPILGLSACIPCPAGRYRESNTTTFCSLCPLGRYQTKAGQSNCINCARGYFADHEGAAECKSCSFAPSDAEADVGATSCSSCGAGYYALENRKNGTTYYECVRCAAGRYSNAPGLTVCNQCPAGRVAKSLQQTTCTTCELGKTSNAFNTDCTECGPGMYSPRVASPTCYRCAPGTYSAENQSTACSACSPGKFQNESGSSTCINCEPGYVSAQGSVGCSACPAGTYASPDQNECLPCPEGKHQPESGGSNCIPCEVGRYSARGSLICLDCPPGKFANETGTSYTCANCPIGRFAEDGASSACDACAPGRYQAIQGSVSCIECPENTFSADPGARECRQCRHPYVSDGLTGASSCICGPGYYAVYDPQALEAIPEDLVSSREWVCIKCPEGAACVHPNTTRSEIGTAEGFWRASPDTLEFYRCPRAHNCPYASAYEASCPQGYEGPMCARCSEGFYKLNERCVACPNSNGLIGVRVTFVSLAALLLASVMVLLVLDDQHATRAHLEDAYLRYLGWWAQQSDGHPIVEPESVGLQHIHLWQGSGIPDTRGPGAESQPGTIPVPPKHIWMGLTSYSNYRPQAKAGYEYEQSRLRLQTWLSREQSQHQEPQTRRSRNLPRSSSVEEDPAQRLGQDVSVTYIPLRTFITFLQLLALLYSLLPVNFPREMWQFYSFASSISLRVHEWAAYECTGKSTFTYFTVFYLTACGPFAMLLCLLLLHKVLFDWLYKIPDVFEVSTVLDRELYVNVSTANIVRGSLGRALLAQVHKTALVFKLISKHAQSSKCPTPEQTQAFLKAFISELYSVQVVKIVGFMWFIFFPQVLRVTSGLFDCRVVGNTRYISGDFTTECGTTAWYLHIIPAVIVIIIYCGPPVYCLVAWSRIVERLKHGKLQGQHRTKETLTSSLHNNSLLQLKASFFVDGYIESKWWFTVGVDTFVKLIAALIIPHAPDGVQGILFSCVIWVYAAWLLWHNPYERKTDDAFHMATLVVVCLCSLLSYLYDAVGHAKSEIGFLDSGSDRIGLILLFVSIGFTVMGWIYLVLRVLWWRFARLRHKAQLSEVLVLRVPSRAHTDAA